LIKENKKHDYIFDDSYLHAKWLHKRKESQDLLFKRKEMIYCASVRAQTVQTNREIEFPDWKEEDE
jgi:hypothetical protein